MMNIDSKSIIQVLLINHPEAERLIREKDSSFHFDHITWSDNKIDFSVVDNDKHYDSIWYIQSEGLELQTDEHWQEVNRRFVRSPKIVWSYEDHNLEPNMDVNAPFLVINRHKFQDKKVQGLLISAQQFYSMIHQSHALTADVEVTQQIADLNIDRLHKTLKDLEKERDKSLIAIKAKQSFLASVTHELRTPLTAIVGFLELLEETALSEDQETYVKVVKSASKNLHSLVNDVLNFSKIEEGKLTIFKESFDLVEEVESSFNMLKSNAISKGLDYSLILEIDKNRFVKGDKLRLNQVLLNLINNAIKFTETGGVSLKVQNPFGDNIIFSIEDTGIGIHESKLEKVFDSFSQAEDFTTHTYGGTGLGLSIVKEIVDLQGGSITVKSEPGKGSTFSFQINFPITEKVTSSEVIINADLSDLEHLKVLVIEDNQLNQMLIQKILDPVVDTLRICGDGESAVIVASEDLFDVILTDLHLPGINGLETIRLIQKKGLNRNTPIAVVSANIWEEELNKIKNAGVEMIIHKPFSKNELLLNVVELSNQKTKPSIDLSYLNEISDNDVEFVNQVLNTFLINSDKDCDLLIKSYKKGDIKNVIEIAHKMRSTLNMLKQTELVNICIDLEEDPSNITAEKTEKFRTKLGVLQGLVRNYLES